MKKSVIIIIFLIGGVAGLLATLTTRYALNATSDAKFCVSCHEMDPMVIAYNADVHGGAGKTGIKADCVSCHMPHDNIVNYVLTKAKNGIVEGAIHFFGDPDAIDWHKNRARRADFVFDDGCTQCHTNVTDNKLFSKKALQMHEHYASLLDTPDKLGCASCHAEVGHTGLNNMLNYWKPEYKIYEKKAAEKKEQIKKEFFGSDYVPPKASEPAKPANSDAAKTNG